MSESISPRTRLLFITQKIHQNDDDLAFTILWVQQFIHDGFDVEVICLEKGDFDNSFPVHSLGKERGFGRFRRALRFLYLVITLHYDRVFVHMNPEYFVLGGWWWVIRRIPTYLWYTHYSMTFSLRMAGVMAKRLFAATPQSLPQFDGNPKKTIVGHGIDVPFWLEGLEASGPVNEQEIISVHRLSRSKRSEIAIRTVALLPEYTLSIYGRAIDPEYFKELNALALELKVQDRVRFNGPVPMGELRHVYPGHRLMLNLAPETIDKSVLEGMVFGVYPVTTKRNAMAIGLPVYPNDDHPETLASFIRSRSWERCSPSALRAIVEERHSLPALIKKMSEHIRAGV